LLLVTPQVALNETGSSLESTVITGAGTGGAAVGANAMLKRTVFVALPFSEMVAGVFETVKTTGIVSSLPADAARNPIVAK